MKLTQGLLIPVISIFSSFSAQATTIDDAQFSTYNLSNGESLLVTENGSVITPVDHAIIADGVTGDFITNNGTLIAEDGGFSRGIYLNNSIFNLITNNGVSSGIGIDDSTVNTIENNGNVGRYLDINYSTVQTVNNNGYIGDEIDVYESSVNTINNYGEMEDGIFSSNSVVGTINNYADINYQVYAWQSDVGTINNYGNIGELDSGDASLFVEQSSVNEINNFGTIKGGVELIQGYVGTLNNSGSVDGGINLNFSSGNGSDIGTLNNSGTIHDGINISNYSSVNQLNNSGTIYDGIHIRTHQTNATEITNSGSILAGNDGNAIDYGVFSYEHVSLNLNGGSYVSGNIAFPGYEGGQSTVNIGAGQHKSSIYYYTSQNNQELVVNAAKGMIVVNEFTPYEGEGYDPAHGKIMIIDPTTTTTTQTSLKPSVEIGNVISSRLDQARADCRIGSIGDDELENSGLIADKKEYSKSDNCVQIASEGNFQLGVNASYKPKTYYWSEVFGSYQDRSAYKNNVGSETSTGGIIFGADKVIASNQRAGAFVGALNGSTDIDTQANLISSKVDTKGLFGGVYLSKNHPTFFTDYSVIVGVLDNNSNRVSYDISTPQIARADYQNIFITPAATIGKAIDLITPVTVSATLRYTGQWNESYSEKGAGDLNIGVDSRYLNSISTRLKIETNNKVKNVAGGAFKVNFRTGLEANRALGNQNVDITALNQTITVKTDNRKYNVDGFVGVNTAFELAQDVEIYADFEGSKGVSRSLSNNNLGLYGKFGLKVSF